MHPATAAFSFNRQKPLPNAANEASSTEIEPLFCRPTGSVTSGTTDDTGIESCIMEASPTLLPPSIFPTDHSNSCGGVKSFVGAAFKPVMGAREQPPPIPPKAVIEIPPLPPKSAPHISPKDLLNNHGNFSNRSCSPLSTSRLEGTSIQNARNSDSDHTCNPLNIIRQKVCHSGEITSEPLPSKNNKVFTKGLPSTVLCQSKSICHSATRHIQQNHSNPDFLKDLCNETSKAWKKQQHSSDGVDCASRSVVSTPLRSCQGDPYNLAKTGVRSPYSSCSCTCQLNRHWETRALLPIPPNETLQSFKGDKTVKGSEVRSRRISSCASPPVQFPQIRPPNSQSKSGCGGFTWLSHTLTRIFRQPSIRESNKSGSIPTTVTNPGCTNEIRPTFGAASCAVASFHGVPCSAVPCASSLWHRRSKSCTTPKFPRAHSKTWLKDASRMTPNHSRVHQSPALPSHSTSVLGSMGTKRHFSITPMSLDRDPTSESQFSPCSDRPVRRNGRFYPTPRHKNQSPSGTARINNVQPDHTYSGRVDIQHTVCSCQQPTVSRQLEQVSACLWCVILVIPEA